MTEQDRQQGATDGSIEDLDVPAEMTEGVAGGDATTQNTISQTNTQNKSKAAVKNAGALDAYIAG